MSLEEIQHAYDKLTSEGNPRALQAILRIGQEQINQRGRLGYLKNLAIMAGLASLLVVLVVPFTPQNIRSTMQVWLWVATAICVLSVGILWRVRAKLEEYLSDEQKIRAMLVVAAQKVVGAPGYTPVPLTDDLRGTLRDAIRHNSATTELSSVLDVH